MKIRESFVSNSSSSSFIVKFPKTPKTVEEVVDMVFKDEKIFSSHWDDGSWNVVEVAKIILDDIKEQEPNNFNVAIEEVKGGHLEGSPDYEEFLDDNGKCDWEAYSEAQDEFSKNVIQEFFNLRLLKLQQLDGKKVLNKALYVFEYSDNEGALYCAMEHGDLFKNLEHIKISKH